MTNSFIPPQRTLMGPGPSDVSSRVLAAMARPTIGHLDPEFVRMMDEVKAMLQNAFRTRNAMTIPVSAPGSAGMETCFVNLIEPGDKVDRLRERRVRRTDEGKRPSHRRRSGRWSRTRGVRRSIRTRSVRRSPSTRTPRSSRSCTPKRRPARGPTHRRCAGLRSDHDCLSIVDAVTSLGGVPLEVDAWGADAVYSGTQKCLSCPPGISPVTMSTRAVDAIRKRNAPVQSWFLDLNLVMAYWGGEGARVYHHTAPVNALYGLHESLVMLEEEGLENSWARHAREHAALRAGVEAIGLRFFVDAASRLPQLNSIVVPDGVVGSRCAARVAERIRSRDRRRARRAGGQGMARRPHGPERVPAQRVVLPERDGSDPRPQRSRCGGARSGVAERHTSP